MIWLWLLACGPLLDNPYARDDDGDGLSEYDGDCDDGDPDVGLSGGLTCLDKDGDWFFAIAWGGFDCDDTDPAVHPLARERYDDHIDQDCDGLAPVDMDGDGFRSIASGGSDCDDDDPTIHPAADELEDDDVDQDCDGLAPVDVDGDGALDRRQGGDDCDDVDASVGPAVAEVCGNRIDDDCDTATVCGWGPWDTGSTSTTLTGLPTDVVHADDALVVAEPEAVHWLDAPLSLGSAALTDAATVSLSVTALGLGADEHGVWLLTADTLWHWDGVETSGFAHDGAAEALHAADLDGDGRTEPITRTPTGVQAWDSTGNLLSSWEADRPATIASADLDGDGLPEVLVGQPDTDDGAGRVEGLALEVAAPVVTWTGESRLGSALASADGTLAMTHDEGLWLVPLADTGTRSARAEARAWLDVAVRDVTAHDDGLVVLTATGTWLVDTPSGQRGVLQHVARYPPAEQAQSLPVDGDLPALLLHDGADLWVFAGEEGW